MAKCPGIPYTKQIPLLVPFLKSSLIASEIKLLSSLLCPSDVLSLEVYCLFLISAEFVEKLKLSCMAELNASLQNIEDQSVEDGPETATPASCSLLSSSCPVMKKLSNSSITSICSRASCSTKKTPLVGVSRLCNLYPEKSQAFAPSPMLSSPTQSSLISVSAIASRASVRWHQMLILFSLKSATFLPYASFSTLWFFFSSLHAHWLVLHASLDCSYVTVVLCRDSLSVSLQQI